MMASMTADERARARDILDLEEGTGPTPVLDEAGALDLLRSARRIAVVGASPDPYRPSHSVMRYLQTQGYECVPVNPNVRDVLGHLGLRDARGGRRRQRPVRHRRRLPPLRADGADRGGCRGHGLSGALAPARGRQLGSGADRVTMPGLAVVMDRCTAIDHRKLRGR